METLLVGQTVLIPRPAQIGQDPLGAGLVELGASVVYSPVIEILPLEAWGELDQALRSMPNFRGIVFLSRNGIQAVVQRAEILGEKERLMKTLGQLHCFTIGQGTAAELVNQSGQTSQVPTDSNSQSMADLLVQQRVRAPFLIFRGNRGSQVLPEQLSSASVPFQQVVAYRSADVTVADTEIVDRLGEGRIQWVVVTSSAIARSLVGLYGDLLRRTRLVSISPTTSGVLVSLGYPPTAEAQRYDFKGLVAAIADSERDQRGA
ncbi:MAG: uroporphyrinogen-III synthase [Planctomycetota bacterium]|nr:uroporphyrinogen-III synthase [Planctomycetota bacterium]